MKMVNFREVNDNDILKEWLDYREQEVFGSLTEEDKKHHIYFDEIVENILRNIPKQSQNMLRNNWIDLMRILWIIFVIGMRSIIGMVFVMGLSWLLVHINSL